MAAGQRPRGLLDTSTVINLPRIIDPTALPLEPLISTVTLAELSMGPLVARTDEERATRQAQLQQAEADFEAVPFDAAAARAFGSFQPHCVATAGRQRRGRTTRSLPRPP